MTNIGLQEIVVGFHVPVFQGFDSFRLLWVSTFHLFQAFYWFHCCNWIILFFSMVMGFHVPVFLFLY